MPVAHHLDAAPYGSRAVTAMHGGEAITTQIVGTDNRYLDAVDWPDYLAVAEMLNLTVLELISASPLTLTTQGAVLSTSLE